MTAPSGTTTGGGGVGFLLVGPALTVGFYAISRDLESGLPPTRAAARSAWRRNPAPRMSLGLIGKPFVVRFQRLGERDQRRALLS